MKFWKSAQALIDGSLIMAFIAMASASMFLGATGGIGGGEHRANPVPIEVATAGR